MSNFSHLHVHTEYSLLDGAARIIDLVKRCVELKQPAVAMTDHGVMYGTLQFYTECMKQKIKPIIGCELYVVPDMMQKIQREHKDHLVLLAKNKQGYHNISKLDSMGFVDGFYGKPRVDLELIAKHSEGVICLTACLAGRVQQEILGGMEDKAEEYLLRLRDIFGDDLYVELQDHGIEEQRFVNPKLIDLANKHKIKMVATNDVHYIEKKDSEMHDVLLCIQTGAKLAEPNRMRFSTNEFYLKSEEEMLAVFPYVKEAIYNTKEVVDKCEIFNVTQKEQLLPAYIPENGVTPEQFLRELTKKGLAEKYDEVTKEIEERAEYELSTIVAMGFVEYYLIVWDFINFAIKNGIPVGCGRGSGVGSIVAYSTGITDVDPLKYDLLFERFLNPERVSMPDFDIDFCCERRGEVIEYVTRKYGSKNVCQIVTFGRLAPKNAIRDTARVYEIPLPEVDKVTKLIPTAPALKVTLHKLFALVEEEFENKRKAEEKKAREGVENANNDGEVNEEIIEVVEEVIEEAVVEEVIEEVEDKEEKKEDKKEEKKEEAIYIPELYQIYEQDETMRRIIKMAMKIEGMPRNTSMHAAGVIICGKELADHVPLQRNGENITTQFTMNECENIGLLKMDFLGLITLTDIKKAKDYVFENHNFKVDFKKLGYVDPEVFKLIGSGDTEAVFQLESGGMKRFMKELKPQSMEDIIAGISLYRPGPMDYIPEYIAGKNAPDKIHYISDALKEILQVTYGVIVYQEQVMTMVQKVAGYSLGQADIIRRAMSKKKKEEMDEHRRLFIYGGESDGRNIAGALKNGMNKEDAEALFDKMEKFASYAFNKSHAAAYATVAYQTAYFMRYYPCEFFCSVLNNRISKLDEIKKYTSFAKERGIEVLQPDINESTEYFKATKDGKLRFGLAAIKSVGEAVVHEIIMERERGAYKDLADFFDRTAHIVNKKMIENLIKAGAFDCFLKKRSVLLAVYEQALNTIVHEKKNKVSGQVSFFDSLIEDQLKEIVYPDIKEYEEKERLELEREVLGIYVTGHPLDSFKDILANIPFNTNSLVITDDSDEDYDDQALSLLKGELKENKTMGGMIKDLKTIMTKSGTVMKRGRLEDVYGAIDVVFFNRVYESNKELIEDGKIVAVTGRVSIQNDGGYQMGVSYIKSLESESEVKEIKVSKQKLYLKIDSEVDFDEVQDILFETDGNVEVVIKYNNIVTGFDYTVGVNKNVMEELVAILGQDCVVLR